MRHLPVPPPNMLDRAIAFVDPARALRRRQARGALAVMDSLSGYGGGYNGASRKRTAAQEWRTRDMSADAALLPDLPTLRDRSRDLVRNVPLAGGAISTVVTNVVGTGLTLRSRIDAKALGLTDDQAQEWQDAAEREWRGWAVSQECDLGRTLRFTAMQDLAFRSVLEAGDVFAVKRYVERPGSVYGLKIQLLEADRCCNPNRATDKPALAGGVEFDGNGAPLAYHFTDRHPGTRLGAAGLQWDRIEAFGAKSGMRQVLHLYRPLRPEQTRGVPYLAPVMEAFKNLGRYSEAELMAAVVNSCFAVVTKTTPGEGIDLPQSTNVDRKSDPINITDPGLIVDLKPDESLESFSPERPTAAFDPFVQAVLRQIGVALELPFEVLIKHFTASYSAAKAALLEVWKFFRTRRQWLAAEFCQPVYEALIVEAVARGRLAAPGFFNDPMVRAAWLGADWIGPSPGQIDTLKEASANKVLVDMGVKTVDEVTMETTGGDWEDNHRQLVRERAARKRDGLAPDPVPALPGQLPAPGAPPADEPDDGREDRPEQEDAA